MKLKDIKQLIELGVAIDITNYSTEQIDKLRPNLTTKKVSFGKYGPNGAIFVGENYKVYAIRTRNTNLAILI